MEKSGNLFIYYRLCYVRRFIMSLRVGRLHTHTNTQNDL